MATPNTVKANEGTVSGDSSPNTPPQTESEPESGAASGGSDGESAAGGPAEDGEKGVLYRHKRRPEWGVAVLAWENRKRRAYQFEDGKLRKFKKGYYDLLTPAEEVERSRDLVIASLQDAAQIRRGSESTKTRKPVCPFRNQVALFVDLFPDGFEDPKWREEHRGQESGRRLKRHRDASIAEAQEELSRERCEALVSDDKHENLTGIVADILAGTDLVPLSAARALRGLSSDESRGFAEGAFRLLHGEGSFDSRFKAYLKLLRKVYGSRPSWRVATGLPALMFPNKQVCVRRSTFKRQAASVAPNGKYSKKARARSYRSFRRMAFAVRKRLQAAGLEPKDLLDVHDFVRTTLSNAALEHVKG